MLGETIKELRTRNNLSLRELGKKTSIHYSRIHAIENGWLPPRKMVVALANGLNGTTESELLKLAGYLPNHPEQVNELSVPAASIFYTRFKQCLEESSISVEKISFTCSIEMETLTEWLHNESYQVENMIPPLTTIYKLANQLGVTSDYLIGYSDAPNQQHPYGPRPKNLREFLDSEEVVFDNIPLDQQDKKKLKKLIVTIFEDR